MPNRDAGEVDMMIRSLINAVFLLMMLLGAAHAATPGSVMFRYMSSDGNVVYSYTLPPGQARHGYDRVDMKSGTVLERVSPQLPPEQMAEKLRREQAMKACHDELERIYALYGSERDIEHARQQELESLERRITQVQANLTQARREQDRLNGQAADVERAGSQIPQSLLAKIERGLSQIQTLEREIGQRRTAQDLARARFQRDLDRFRDGSCPEPAGTLAADNAL